MLRASYDVARLTKIARVRCRPELFVRSRSTSTFETSEWAQSLSRHKQKPRPSLVKEEDSLEERPGAFARQKIERQDYELAKTLQRTPRRRKSTGEADGRPKRALPSLRDRRSFQRPSTPKVPADTSSSTSSAVTDTQAANTLTHPVSKPSASLSGSISVTSDPSSSTSSTSASPNESVSIASDPSSSTSSTSASPSSSTSVESDWLASTSTSSTSATVDADQQPRPSRKGKEKAVDDDGLRRNAAGVQLLSHSLHQQLFPGPPLVQPPQTLIDLSRAHLAKNGLNADGAAKLAPIDMDLPPLRGSNIREHFHAIGRQEAEPYLSMAHRFAKIELPPIPDYWASTYPGWVKYSSDGSYEPVKDLGDEEVVVFDVEVLYKISPYPVIATAATETAWYSWLCPTIFQDPPSEPNPPRERWDPKVDPQLPHDLIPLFAGSKSRLLVGHNVSYDRARIKDEYGLTPTGTRFLDTLSLHVATRGITSVQRPAWMKRRKDKEHDKNEKMKIREATIEILREVNPEWAEAIEREQAALLEDEDGDSHFAVESNDDSDAYMTTRWEDHTAMNSLKEVAALHCGTKVDKSIRDRFGDESITHASQLQEDLQDLIQYCADDVKVTHDVFKKVFPLFIGSCPHPASFAGALHMGSAILPVDEEWGQYIKTAEETFQKMSDDVKTSLRSLAEKLRLEGPTPDDPWHSQLDWTPKKARWAETGDDAPPAARIARETAQALIDKSRSEALAGGNAGGLNVSEAAEPVVHVESEVRDPKVQPESEAQIETVVNEDTKQSQTPSQPQWYTALNDPDLKLSATNENIILPLLLQVTYNGLPVVCLKQHLWCFLAPADGDLTHHIKAHGEPVLPEEADASALKDLKQYRIFSMGKGKTKKAKLLGKTSRPLLQNGILSSPYPDLLEKAISGETEAVISEIPRLASALLEAGAGDIFADQLQNVFRDSGDGHQSMTSQTGASKGKKNGKKASVDDGLGTWPSWYWELTKPSSRLPPGELDLTQKKSVAPLLLRLEWEGYPLIISRAHKWLFKVPSAHVEERGWTKDGAVHDLGQPVTWSSESKGDEHLSGDNEHYYFRLPHVAGEGNNVGNPLAKNFIKSLECGQMSSAKTAGDNVTSEIATTATKMNSLCSYWISTRERIMDQMVVYEDSSNQGYILPKVVAMGTVTRRAVEATWLTASNAKKNRVGSELKAMVKAPPGYALVGADVDSEELWISSVMGDSQFGMHGATAIGWMTLEGTKAAGTDLHSKTAAILGTSRDAAKVFNYSRIYGAGVKHAVQLLMQGDPTLTKEAATAKAKALYAATKGEKSVRDKRASPAEMPSLWHGGSESYLFNTLETIALSERPTTPALGCGVTRALSRKYLNAENTYLPSRVNWVVQSSGVDYLHLLIVSMSYLIKRYDIKARYLISVHDEVRYMVQEQDKYRAALALQIANAWTRALFCYNLGMDDAPQGVTFFSAVDIDHVLRKEVNMPCVTPSHPNEIPPGESLDINQLMAIVQSLGQATSYDVDPSFIPTEPTKPPVTLFSNIHSSSHYRFLQAQAERQGARAKWWLDSQKPLIDSETGKESLPPAMSSGQSKGAKVNRMRSFSSRLGDAPLVTEIEDMLEAYEAYQAEGPRRFGKSR